MPRTSSMRPSVVSVRKWAVLPELALVRPEPSRALAASISFAFKSKFFEPDNIEQEGRSSVIQHTLATEADRLDARVCSVSCSRVLLPGAPQRETVGSDS